MNMEKRIDMKYLLLNAWASEEEYRELNDRLAEEVVQYQIVIVPDQMKIREISCASELGKMEVGNVYIVKAPHFDESMVLQQGLYAGISNVHSGTQSLRKAYREAYMARNYAFFYQIDGVRVSEIPSIVKDEVRKQELCENIPNKTWLEMHELVKRKKISYADFKSRMDMVISDIAANLPPELEQQRELIVECCKRPQGYTNMIHWMNELNRLWENIQFMERLSSIVSDEGIWLARKYIRENYKNPYLNAKEICEVVHMSYSAFSKRFGNEDGISFKEYLRKVRITHAVECLKNPKATISGVARECGYEDTRVFIENFRKIKSMTPREYQRWYQNREE